MGRNETAQWIASLHFPSQAAKVLAHERYWNLDCLGAYLRAAAEFCARQPADGRHVSQVGLQLAQLLPRGPRRQQLLIRALALHAWAHQTCGSHAEALGLYRTAFQLTERTELEPWIAGDLLRRYASFLRLRANAANGDLAQALEAAERAVELLRDPPAESSFTDWQLELGRALVERALVHHQLQRPDSTVADLGMALESLDPHRHETEIRYCLGLLAEVADLSSTLDHLHRVARQVALFRDRIGEPTDGSAVAISRLAARVLQLDADLFCRMGALQRAERSLRRARRLLRRLSSRCGHDAAFLSVSLDLAELLAKDERLDELRRLSSDTLGRVVDSGFSLTRYRWRRALASGRLDSEELQRIRLALGEEHTPGAGSQAPSEADDVTVVGVERPTAVGE